MSRVENYTPHTINIIPDSDLGLDRVDFAGGERVPRAKEATVKVLGFVGIRGFNVPVLQQSFNGIIDAPPLGDGRLKLVSHETIIAAHRSGRPIGDLVYPFGIVRDANGDIAGCRGLAMPERVEPARPIAEPALTEADVAMLTKDDIVNRSNFGMNVFDPAYRGDEIDLAQDPPIFSQPTDARLAVDLTPGRRIDDALTEQTGVPIYHVWPEPGSVHNFPEDDGELKLNLLHPIALRHAAILGEHSLRYCGLLGGLLRDSRRKTVTGGRAFYVLDPAMLSRDGF